MEADELAVIIGMKFGIPPWQVYEQLTQRWFLQIMEILNAEGRAKGN